MKDPTVLYCYYCDNHSDFFLDSHCHRAIVDNLERAYPHIEFRRINSDTCRYKHDSQKKCHANDKYGYHSLIIENRETSKYSVVTYMDKIDYMFDDCRNWDIENLVDVYASSGMHMEDTWYTPFTKLDVIPFTYHVATREHLTAIEAYDGIISKTMPESPPFRGKLYRFRKHLSTDPRFPDVKDEYLRPDKYIHHMASNSINLSLNGVGGTCQRDMEILATGTCLFRPELNAKFHDPLIPNEHYISFKCDPSEGNGNFNRYYEAQADALWKRWNEVKDDQELIDRVAKNGKAWYERNGTVQRNGTIGMGIIDIGKLI